MSKELIFSIENVFNSTTEEGALTKNNAQYYYIPPYQRGYKWKSEKPNHAVCVLLRDLMDASENPNSEYYLQFITTKRTKLNGNSVLEVIDGQQRLTTITLLLSVLSFLNKESIEAISNNKLSYEVREKVTEFYTKFIYNGIDGVFFDSWSEFITEHSEYDEQDIYYLFSAVNKIYSLLSIEYKDNKQGLVDFEHYLKKQVKIILNNIERDINCEELFSNLNDNKVDLTSSELIKGLFLTKSARETGTGERLLDYNEILEKRSGMGRQWDEITHWINRTEINTFYFSGRTNALDQLLLLLAIADGFEQVEYDLEINEVFNYFLTQIKKNNKKASDYFEELKKMKLILSDWFNDYVIYNSLGFLLHSKEKKKTFNLRDILSYLKNPKSKLRNELRSLAMNLIPENIQELEYGPDNNKLQRVLLALSIFSEEKKFDFTSFLFNQETWSLEHVFPQTPEKLTDVLGKKDITLIQTLIGDKLNDFSIIEDSIDEDEFENPKDLFDTVKKKLNQDTCFLKEKEKEFIYKLIRKDKLNTIGNLTLLTGPDNSSNRNGMFDKKRNNIVKRISHGSFVPKHTYDVFSKLVSKKMTPDLTVWTEEDILAHQDWIISKINEIKSVK